MVLLALSVIIVLLESVLLGSIPWGVVLSRLILHDDVRKHGSGNIGTTNMIRAFGKKIGYACFVLDFLKAIAACALAAWLTRTFVECGWITVSFAASGTLGAVALFGTEMGHMFSPWLGFKGGKGIASGVACVLMVLGPWYALAEVALFALIVIATRYVSAGSIAAAALMCVLGFVRFWGNWWACALVLVTGLVVIWAHRQNIERLRAGNENKIGHKE